MALRDEGQPPPRQGTEAPKVRVHDAILSPERGDGMWVTVFRKPEVLEGEWDVLTEFVSVFGWRRRSLALRRLSLSFFPSFCLQWRGYLCGLLLAQEARGATAAEVN